MRHILAATTDINTDRHPTPLSAARYQSLPFANQPAAANPPEYRLIDDGVVRHIPVGPAMVDDLDSAIDDRTVYFHLDCDVLEPGVVPTDYRVPNGISLDELGSVARRLAENRIVGVEVAEFEGSWGGNGSTR
jgi:arginase